MLGVVDKIGAVTEEEKPGCHYETNYDLFKCSLVSQRPRRDLSVCLRQPGERWEMETRM